MTANDYQFVTSCVSAKGEDIQEMIDNSRPVKWETFYNYIRPSIVQELFPTYKNSSLNIEDDYAVTVHKSKYRGKRCYYICWSAIEFVFQA